jgi:hypothetical protein
MKPLLNTIAIINVTLAVAFLVLAIIAYRAKGTNSFLLLMLASICYFLPRFTPVVVGLLFEIRGWETSTGYMAWFHSSGSFVIQLLDLLFVGLLVAALISFIRARRVIVTPHV